MKLGVEVKANITHHTELFALFTYEDGRRGEMSICEEYLYKPLDFIRVILITHEGLVKGELLEVHTYYHTKGEILKENVVKSYE